MSDNAMNVIILFIEFIGIPLMLYVVADIIYYIVKKEHI